MSFKRARVKRWAAAELPDDTFVSYVVTGTGAPTQPTASDDGAGDGALPAGERRREELVAQLGLASDNEVGAAHGATFFVLTDRHLVLGSRSSFRNRPQELVHSAPIDRVRVHWFDHDDGPNASRHFVTDFGDGRWRADFTGLKALWRELPSNAVEYVSALGDRAVEVPSG